MSWIVVSLLYFLHIEQVLIRLVFCVFQVSRVIYLLHHAWIQASGSWFWRCWQVCSGKYEAVQIWVFWNLLYFFFSLIHSLVKYISLHKHKVLVMPSEALWLVDRSFTGCICIHWCVLPCCCFCVALVDGGWSASCSELQSYSLMGVSDFDR